jgi:hypothetical protein
VISTRISTAGVTAENVRPLVSQCSSIQQFTQDLHLDLRDAGGQPFDGEISSISKWLKSGGSIALKTTPDSPGLVVSSNESDLQPEVKFANEKPFIQNLSWNQEGRESLTIWSPKDVHGPVDKVTGFDLSQNTTVFELHHTPSSQYKMETYTIRIKQDVVSTSVKDTLGISKMLRRSESKPGLETASVGWQYSHGLATGKREPFGMPAYATQQIQGTKDKYQETFQWTDKDGQQRICDGYRDAAGQRFFQLEESDSDPTPEQSSSDLAQLADQLQLAEEGMRTLGDSFCSLTR